jgi:predicted TIM-barrel fold metal-dependent hydrolase
MLRDTYHHFHDFLDTLPVISTHEHHLEDSDQKNLDLEGVIERSYVGWQEIPFGTSDDDHRNFLNQIRHNSYFVWLEKALDRLYEFGGRITEGGWKDLSQKIAEKHRDSGWHLRILREKCGYQAGISDIYWDTGSDLGHGDLFRPVVRTDMFVKCFHPEMRDHDDNSPWKFMPIQNFSFGEYMDYLEKFHRNKISSGAVAFKLATAYERTIAINETSYDEAARVYMKHPKEVSEKEALAYGDYIINRMCDLAAELEVPYQVHTGLGQLAGSNPLNLERTIDRHPETIFVLFHGGFPWYHEIGALAHNHSNVNVDMVWLPLISPSAAKQALHEYIEVVPSSDRIAWGSDSWTSEEAFGALIAWKHVLAAVLSEKVDEDYFNLDEAEIVAKKLMFLNARKIYKL